MKFAIVEDRCINIVSIAKDSRCVGWSKSSKGPCPRTHNFQGVRGVGNYKTVLAKGGNGYLVLALNLVPYIHTYIHTCTYTHTRIHNTYIVQAHHKYTYIYKLIYTI